MPFGAEATEPGRARFRLWAPSAREIELCLGDQDGETRHAMKAEADGWFSLEAGYPESGHYRFRVDGDLRVPDAASRFQPNRFLPHTHRCLILTTTYRNHDRDSH